MKIHLKIIIKLKEHLFAKEISIIIGSRQVGKTTLMKELLSELQHKNERTLDIFNEKQSF